jgi:predicted DNA-binding protein (MmcQ/YjbR family)
MHIEELQDYCMTKNGVTAQFPFDEVTLVFKVMGKIFCLAGLDRFERGEPSINLKCDPEKAVVLREHYDGAVIPGYHASKKHWNTVLLNRDIPQKELRTWIDHSYDIVASKLTRAEKESLKNL